MTVKELKEKLSTMDDNALVICGAYNGFTDTYGVVDYIMEDYYNRTIYNDLRDTMGQIDGRLLRHDLTKNKDQKTVYIGTSFPSNYSIGEQSKSQHSEEIPRSVWEDNGFTREYDDDGPFWSYLKEFTEADNNGDFAYEMINYYKENYYYVCELHCRVGPSYPPKLTILINPSFFELEDAMKFMGFEKQLNIAKYVQDTSNRVRR